MFLFPSVFIENADRFARRPDGRDAPGLLNCPDSRASPLLTPDPHFFRTQCGSQEALLMVKREHPQKCDRLLCQS